MSIRACTPAGTLAAVLLVLISGCLPYSCRREEPTALMPADSLSRAIAAEAPTDTLDFLWSAGEAFEYPRTVRFGDSGPSTSRFVYVADVERDAVIVLGENGTLLHEIGDLAVPYLAGMRGDTLAAFSPPNAEMHLLVSGEVVATISVDDPERSNRDLIYAAYGPPLFYKRVPAEGDGFIARVDRSGRLHERHPLPGPQWRRAGLLRTWGDTLVSLSGYRPVVDLLSGMGQAGGDTAGGARLDTLALRGFDSPMLPRSHAFLLGDVSQAPLLTPSAAFTGDRLFVINIRMGWLQVDVFDRDGMLRRRLVERDPAYSQSFFPQDLDVRLAADGTYRIAVVLTEPAPELRVYAWRPDLTG